MSSTATSSSSAFRRIFRRGYRFHLLAAIVVVALVAVYAGRATVSAPGAKAATATGDQSIKTAYLKNADGTYTKLADGATVKPGDVIEYAIADSRIAKKNLNTKRGLVDTMSSGLAYVPGSLTQLNQGAPGITVQEPTTTDWSGGRQIATFDPVYAGPSAQQQAGKSVYGDPVFGNNSQYVEGVSTPVTYTPTSVGDGFNPTFVRNAKGELITWSITHHDGNETINCQFVDSKENCISGTNYWGSSLGTIQDEPTLTIGTKGYMLLLNEVTDTYYIGCVDFANVAPGVPPTQCGAPVPVISGATGSWVEHKALGPWLGADGKLYTLATPNSGTGFLLGCYDPATNAVCSGFSATGNRVATTWNNGAVNNMLFRSAILLPGGKIEFTTDNIGSSATFCAAVSGTTLVSCDGSPLAPVASGSGVYDMSVPIVTAAGSGMVTDATNSPDRVTGWCVGPFGGVARECFDLNGASIGMPYPGLQMQYTGNSRLHDGFAYPSGAAQVIYALDYGSSEAACYDFATRAPCAESPNGTTRAGVTWRDVQTINGTTYYGKIYGARMIPGTNNCMVSLGDSSTFLYWHVDANGVVTPDTGGTCTPLRVRVLDMGDRYCEPGTQGFTQWDRLDITAVRTGTSTSAPIASGTVLSYYAYDPTTDQVGAKLGSVTLNGGSTTESVARPAFLDYTSTKNFVIQVDNPTPGLTYQFTQYNLADASPSVCYQAKVVDSCTPATNVALTNYALWGGSPSVTSNTVTLYTSYTGNCIELTKTAGAVSGPDASGTYHATYTITVQNTSGMSTTYGPITDTPGFTAGTTITGATYTKNGGAATALTGSGPYTLGTAGMPLAAGAKDTYTLDVAFTMDPAQATAVTQCDPNAPAAGKGLFNAASVPGDTDLTNNDACLNPPARPGITLDKKADKTSYVAGQTITYTFTVTNTGNVTLAPVTISDAKLGLADAACVASLAPGQTATCSTTKAYVATPADVTAGSIVNTATATGTTPAGGTVTDTDTNTVLPGAISLLKSSGGVVDANGSGSVDAGDTITYSFTVTNTGKVALSNITITDAKLAITDKACYAGPLAPGATATCTFTQTYALTAADITSGSVTNTAVAKGTTPDGGTPTDDSSTVTPLIAPRLALVKSVTDVNGDKIAQVGENLTFSFLVTNTGNTTLSGITVDDPMLAAAGVKIFCPVTTLAPGASTTCTSAPYTTTQADVSAGSVNNTATARGTAPEFTNPDGSVTPSAPVQSNPSSTTTPTEAPRLTLTKSVKDASGNGVAELGEKLTYTFVVTNTGTVTVEKVTVVDPMLSTAGVTITCASATLAPGASTTCTSGAYTTTADDVAAGRIDNVATSNGTTPVVTNPTVTNPDGTTSGGTTAGGTPVQSNEAPATIPTPGPQPALSLVKSVKDANGDKVAQLGEQLVFSFLVTNTGTVTETNVKVSDPMLAAAGVTITCPQTTLAPGASTTCTSTPYTTTAADVSTGQVHNTATATGTNPDGSTVTSPPSDTTTPTEKPSLALTKSVKDASANGIAELGETLTYTFVVKNTGNVTLTGVTVADPMLAAAGVTVTCATTTLAPGASTTCTSTGYTTTQADVNSGAVDNVATARGTTLVVTNPDGTTSGGSQVPSNEAPATIPTPTPAPALTLLKSVRDANGDGVAQVGEKLIYSFVMTNTGNVTLSNVRLDDPMLAAAGVTVACPMTTLVPGQSMTCTSAPYTTTPADVTAGKVDNVATARGTTPTGVDVPSNPSTTTVPTEKPHLTLLKSVRDASGNGIAELGETLTYSFRVTNDGNVTLSGITVTDAMLAAAGVSIACPTTTLAPGASTTCTSGPYTTTASDVASGAVDNIAVANGTTPVVTNPDGTPTGGTKVPSNQSPATIPTPAPAPALTLVKTVKDANGDKVAQLGEQLVFSFVVTNSGNVPLTNVRVDDPMLAAAGVAISCPATTLAVGQTMTCTSAPYTTTQADVTAGRVANTATAHGTTPPITNPDGTLTPGTDTPSDPSTTTTPTEKPHLTLVKSVTDASGNGVAELGETLTFSFRVTNDGNVALANLRVDDPMLRAAGVTVTCPVTSLAVGASTTCTSGAYTVTQADILAGKVVNTATAHGTTPPVTNPDGTTTPGKDTPSDPSTTTTPTPAPAPGLALVKSAKDASGNGIAEVGESMTFTFVVTNTGNLTLTNVTVKDPMLAAAGVAIACPTTTLAPGASTTCTSGAYTVTQADVNNGRVTNTATATGTTPDGTPTTSTPSTTTTPTPQGQGIALEKTVKDATGDRLAQLGEELVFSFVVTNTGQVSLTDVRVDDPTLTAAGVAVMCPRTTLVPGESMTCTSAPYTTTQADLAAGSVDNIATAHGTTPPKPGPDGTPVPGVDVPSTPDSTTTPTEAPKLTLVKAVKDASGNGIAELGETLTYTFVVTNTGNVTLNGLVVDDAMLKAAGVAVTCQVTTLAPGASTTCTSGAYTTTTADVMSGAVDNIAVSRGTTPTVVNPPVTNPDGTTTPGGTVPGTTVPSNESPATIPTPTPAPALTLVKTVKDANGDKVAQLGEQLVFSFVVTNSGNVPLTNVRVDDPMLATAGVAVTCPKTELAVGEPMTCTSAPYTTTQADVTAGRVANTATAHGTTPPTPNPDGTTTPGTDTPSEPSTTTTPTEKPHLTLKKSVTDASGNGVAELGEELTYSFVLTNDGNVTLEKLAVTDEMLKTADVTVTCPTAPLAPGASTTCTSGPYATTQADVDAGSVDNIATAAGVTPVVQNPGGSTTGGTPVPSNESPATIPTPVPAPALTLVKKVTDVSGDKVAQLGEHLTFTFDVKNTGNVTLTDIRVDDTMLTAAGVTVTCPTTTLAPGATTTCTSAPYTTSEADVAAGTVANTATAHGTTPGTTDENGNPVPGTDVPSKPSTTTTPTEKPALTLTKSVTDASGNDIAELGEKLTYHFTVENTGNVTLENVAVDDPKLKALTIAVTCEKTTLAPGERTTCTSAEYTTTQADVDAGSVDNVATSHGTTPKVTNPPVENPDGTTTPETTVGGTPVPSNEAPATIPTPAPAPRLTLVKSVKDATGDGVAQVGEKLTFSFLVTNSGNVTLSDVKIDDPMLAEAGVTVTCPTTTLEVGASTTCTSAPYTATEADATAGSVDNVATAHGTTPPTTDENGNPVPPKDVPSEPSETTTPMAQPKLTLVKSVKDADGDGTGIMGEALTFSFRVTNVGNVTVEEIVVDDPMLAGLDIEITCPETTLEPEESTTCTSGAYHVTAADVQAGSVRNVATAKGVVPPPGPGAPTTPVPSNPSTTVTPVDDPAPLPVADPDPAPVPTTPGTHPGIALVKKAQLDDRNRDGKGNLGETITYTFVVSNTGTEPLTNVAIDDPLLRTANVRISCPKTELAVAEKMTCTSGAYRITEADVRAGQVVNVATATATGITGKPTGGAQVVTPTGGMDVGGPYGGANDSGRMPAGGNAGGGAAPDSPVQALAYTGAEVATWSVIGGLLLAGGLVLVLGSRRRKEADET